MKLVPPPPELYPCDVCGLEVQAGDGPTFYNAGQVRLCWHNCRQALDMRAEADPKTRNPTIEDFAGMIMGSLQAQAASGALRPETAVQALRAVAEVMGAQKDGAGTFDISEALKGFIARRPGESGAGASTPSGPDSPVRGSPSDL